MPLVEHDVAPVDAPAERGAHRLRRGHLVCREDDVERAEVGERLALEELALLAVGRVQPHDAQRRRPLAELAQPRREDGERADDEVGAGHLEVEREEAEECDGLHGLAEAHVVGEDAVDAVAVRLEQPIDAVDLVRLEGHLQPRQLRKLLRGERRGGVRGRLDGDDAVARDARHRE